MLVSYAIEFFTSLPLAIPPPGPLEIGIFLFPLYFLPTIISLVRNINGKLGVFLLNGLLGWTVIGWVAALVISLTKSRKKVQNLPVAESSHSQDEVKSLCSNCGAKTAAGMKYCPECGAKITTTGY
ncbi:MAG: superinfection immunity protein [Dehalococcoidales bacterium]|nr:superinfection immunity protein [Dehalococcoidales bacterium]